MDTLLKVNGDKKLTKAIDNKQNGVVEALVEAILTGGIPGGTEMTQKDLAESLGVSRMPVREALLVLEYQGLVERLPNNHVRVTDVSATNVNEIFDMCCGLEKEAVAGILGDAEAFADVFTSSPLLDDGAKELAAHRNICNLVENPFKKRTLTTIVETYVAHRIGQADYDNAKGLKLLKDFAKGKNHKYFDNLKE